MIKIKNLNKYYNKNKSNELHVINNANIEISSPGLVTFLGSSGAGKSTLLHVIGGLDKARGDVIYDDVNLLKKRSNAVDNYRNEHIGYIFQNYNLLPDLTVYENLRVQLELINIYDKAVIDEKINECLKVVGLEKYKRRKVTALSGGQQQRVAIARALVKGAEVIIADEPTGNLDTKNSMDVLNILKIISKKYLVILVTHNINLAYHYSDRILKIKDGKIIEDLQNKNNNSLLHVDSNAIYLNEYKKEDLSNNIKVYTKNNEELNFKIIIENDAIYIENNNNLPIRVLNDNTDRYIIEENYEEEYISEEDVLKLNYKKYNKISFKQKFKYIFKDVKNSFLKMIYGSKKTKMLYISFFFIGIILCLCLNSLSISTTISNDFLEDVPKNAVQMDLVNASQSAKFGYTIETEEILSLMQDKQEILGIVDTVNNPYLSFKVISNRSTSINIHKKCFVTTPRFYNDIELKDEEIIISKKVADQIIYYTKGYQIDTYDKLIGKEFYLSLPKIYNGNVIIKDILDTPDYTFVLSDHMYLAEQMYQHQSTSLSYSYDINRKYFSNYIPIKDYIPKGDSFSIDKKLPNVIVSEALVEHLVGIDYFASKGMKNKIWKTGSAHFNVIGYVEEDDFNVVFQNMQEYNKFVENSLPYIRSYLPYDKYDIKLVEGSSYPVNDYEILLPDTYDNRIDYPIGSSYTLIENDYVYYQLKVVGYFKLDYPNNLSHLYVNYRTAYLIKSIRTIDRILKNNVKMLYFYTTDQEVISNYIEELGYPSGNPEKIMLQNTIFEKLNLSKIVIIISVCIIVVMILFIFFINRSKMMHNIYDIGVLRALGAKKNKIYKEYIIDSIIITTFTVALGFTFTYFFTYNANNFIPGISVELKYYFISIVCIYLAMILASILPIYMLLRKTPIEIINKYDI